VAGLRNQPVDRRYLRDDEQEFSGGKRQLALKRAQARRGYIAYQANGPKRTTLPKSLGKSHTGDFAYGIGAQQLRLQEKSADLARSKSLRPEKMDIPNI
jgi:hypothetical protein